MTQVWPDFGVAPVATLLSMICNPEAVVMGFPAVWADAIRGTAIGVATAATTVANAVRMIVRREDRISVHLVRETDVSIAFSSEVDTGSREENASKTNLELRF